MLTDDDLAGMVGEVWTTVLMLDLERDPAGGAFGSPPLTATIQITGSWQWTVRLDCTPGLAGVVAGAMFGTDPDDTPIDDVRDALGEIANIVAGTVKSALGGSYELSLPMVTDGPGYHVPVPGTTERNQVAFRCAGHPLRVTVLQQSHGQAAGIAADRNYRTMPQRSQTPP